jgi:mandelate racemase
MPTNRSLTIRGLQVRGVNVPMRRPLATGAGTLDTAPLVLVDLATHEGVTRSSYIFCYTPVALEPMTRLISGLEAFIAGDIVAPLAIEQKLQRRLRLVGPHGFTAMAMAAIDMAAWDALARAADLPLVRLLGGERRPIPAYNSCGLGIIGSQAAAAEATELLDGGRFRAIKVRLGYPDVQTDLEVVRSVRRAVGSDVALMSDYNQSLSVNEAIQRARLLDGERLSWIEEPTLADDYIGHAQISRETATPIQLGENWWGPREMAKSLSARASDCVMPDACRIGGVSGWLRAAALAESAGLAMSCHLFPEVSAHLLAVTPTSDWLEYVDWASPILARPLEVHDGHALPSEEPGLGLRWDEEAVRRYRVA